MRFIARSVLILLLLYGIVFAVGTAYLAHVGAPLWSGLVFAVLFALIQFAIAPWIIELILDIYWDENRSQLPARNYEFIEHLCAERGLKLPRIGVIQSGTPNAFSFGHTPSDARVVVTTGLLDILTPEEANAVLAHEIGHIEHWDFVVMTVAALAPLILYQIYIWTDRINNVRFIAYTAYLCYLLSQFIVLMLNRTREYFADHYSAEVTKAPNDLSSALVKIACGMVRAEGEYKAALADKSRSDQAELKSDYRRAGSLALMGISNLRSGTALALGLANASEATAVMRWDLVNPWAKVYELNSTHPLTALRVCRLNADAEALHQVPQYPLSEGQSKHWGLFPIELLLWAVPVLTGLVCVSSWWVEEPLRRFGIELPPHFQPLMFILTGSLWIIRVWYRYRGEFQPAAVGDLIQDLDVSQMRPRAIQVTGEIIGRGVPGAFWSPDLVLRDESGIVFILYRQTIPFLRFLFAISAAENYIGQKVTIDGWFRRGLAPYVEMSRLTGKDGETHRAFSRWVQYALAGMAIVIGYLWLSA
jgi:heat shock protein HtpX